MTELINIQNREQFENFLSHMRQATIVAADTETNGLEYYRRHNIISISVYLPEFDISYNLPFFHGIGTIDVRYNASTEGKAFNEMSWQGYAKSDIYLAYWFDMYRKAIDFGNLPSTWYEEIKDVWGLEGVTYIFHNARFDLHMLHADGYPVPDTVLDTLLELHILHEDWRGIRVDAPYKNAQGEWTTTLKKKQNGNRQLKWQANFWGLPNAHVGENELLAAKNEFEDTLARFIVRDHLANPMNAGLVYAKFKGATPEEMRHAEHYDTEWFDKQVDRIAKKLKLNSKSHMWMLPSDKVATYAMMDTVLTYQLHQKISPMLASWHNTELFEHLCYIQLHVAWEMEKNGIKLDKDEAYRQIDLYTPRIAEIEEIFNVWGLTLSFSDAPEDTIHNMILAYDELNPSSPMQLLPYLNSALQHPFDLSLMPQWMDESLVRGLVNEPMLDTELSSTSIKELDDYRKHPVVALLLEYRKLQKTIKTYLNKWLSAVDPDGLIHPSMNMDGTVSGRLSSSGDMGNGQNIPERGGYTIKRSLVAYPEHILFSIDYEQLEARIASWIAETLLPSQGAYVLENRTMTNLFVSGEDMHSYARDMINVKDTVYPNMSYAEIAVANGVNPSKFSEEGLIAYVDRKILRQMAKTLNFGLLYSGTHYMVMTLLGIGKEQAIALVDKWRKLFPAFQKAQDYYETLAQQWRVLPNGKGRGMYVTQPITGRHRKFHKYDTWMWYYDSDNVRKGFNPREAEARKAWNNVVQGLSGFLSVDSALEYYGAWGKDAIKFFAQIHDALDGNAQRDQLWHVEKLMNCMVDYDVTPSLGVSLEAGTNWQPATEYDNPHGMREVEDLQTWINSGGHEGYKGW